MYCVKMKEFSISILNYRLGFSLGLTDNGLAENDEYLFWFLMDIFLFL